MRALTTPQLWVNGKPLWSLADWGELVITHRWPYGCWEATWNMVLKPYQRVPDVAADVPVEIRMGSGKIWAGDLADPDWDSGSFRAVGAARQGETSLCLNSLGETTTWPDDAIDQAISRGAVDWIRRESLLSGPFGASGNTGELNYLTALLDAWSTSVSKRWGVNAHREVYAATDPTTPSMYLRPGVGSLGVTEETQAARIFGRYQNTSGVWDTDDVGSGRPEVGVSLLAHGPISSATATAIITGMRDQLQARTGWTNGVTVTADQVTNPGGVDMGLDQVVAGKMARMLGLRDERGGEASTDVVLGETVWNVNAGTVVCNPVGLTDNSLAGVVEAGGGELL